MRLAQHAPVAPGCEAPVQSAQMTERLFRSKEALGGGCWHMLSQCSRDVVRNMSTALTFHATSLCLAAAMVGLAAVIRFLAAPAQPQVVLSFAACHRCCSFLVCV